MTFRPRHAPPQCLAPLTTALLLVARAGTCADAAPANAEAPAPAVDQKTVALTANLVTPFFGAYLLVGKVRASDHFALVVNASYLSLKEHDWKANTGTVGVGLDYYFAGDALRGFYVEAIGELWLSSWRHEPSRERAPLVPGYAGIALVGYEFVFDAGPVIDLGLGVVAYCAPSARVELASGTVTSDAITKVYPAPKIEVGWAF